MEKFLGISPLKRIYFCRDDKSTFFTNECPQDCVFFGVVHVKFIPGCECDIYIYHRSAEESSMFEIPTRSRNVHLLKSLLQKSIRRGCVSVAQRSARDLMLESPIELIRRLPIIMIEDTTVFHEIVDLVFDLLCGRMLDISRPLKYVSMLAHTKKRYVPNSKSVSFSKKTLFDKCIKHINEPPSMVAFALLLRASYGGMQGDVNMLVHAAQLVMDKKMSIETLDSEECTFSFDTRILNLTDWIIDAVDFHCCSNILTYAADKTGMDPTTVKKLMWKHASKINCRDPQSSEESEEWLRIAASLKEYRLSIIRQSYHCPKRKADQSI